MPFLTTDEARIFYRDNETDADLALLMLHGSGCDHSVWPDPLFAMEGVRAIAIDLPGRGRSDGDAPARMDARAESIQRFVSGLGPQRVVVAGHSLGGAIALTLGLDAPPWLAGLILVGTGARLRVAPALLHGLSSPHPAGALRQIRDWSFGPGAPAEMIEDFHALISRTDPKVTHADLTACDHFDAMADLERIAAPTLVISATDDQLTPIKYGRYLKDRIAGAELAVIERAGHMMAMEQPAAFTGAVEKFMARIKSAVDKGAGSGK